MPANWKDVPGDLQHQIADRFRDIADERAHPDHLPDWYENIAAHSLDGGETGLDDIMSPPRYADYKLPGAENYREKLLTLPVKRNIQVCTTGRGRYLTSLISARPSCYRILTTMAWIALKSITRALPKVL